MPEQIEQLPAREQPLISSEEAKEARALQKDIKDVLEKRESDYKHGALWATVIDAIAKDPPDVPEGKTKAHEEMRTLRQELINSPERQAAIRLLEQMVEAQKLGSGSFESSALEFCRITENFVFRKLPNYNAKLLTLPWVQKEYISTEEWRDLNETFALNPPAINTNYKALEEKAGIVSRRTKSSRIELGGFIQTNLGEDVADPVAFRKKLLSLIENHKTNVKEHQEFARTIGETEVMDALDLPTEQRDNMRKAILIALDTLPPPESHRQWTELPEEKQRTIRQQNNLTQRYQHAVREGFEELGEQTGEERTIEVQLLAQDLVSLFGHREFYGELLNQEHSEENSQLRLVLGMMAYEFAEEGAEHIFPFGRTPLRETLSKKLGADKLQRKLAAGLLKSDIELKRLGVRAPNPLVTLENMRSGMGKGGKYFLEKVLSFESPVTVGLFLTYMQSSDDKVRAMLDWAGFMAVSKGQRALSAAAVEAVEMAAANAPKASRIARLARAARVVKHPVALIVIGTLIMFYGHEEFDAVVGEVDSWIPEGKMKHGVGTGIEVVFGETIIEELSGMWEPLSYNPFNPEDMMDYLDEERFETLKLDKVLVHTGEDWNDFVDRIKRTRAGGSPVLQAYLEEQKLKAPNEQLGKATESMTNANSVLSARLYARTYFEIQSLRQQIPTLHAEIRQDIERRLEGVQLRRNAAIQEFTEDIDALQKKEQGKQERGYTTLTDHRMEHHRRKISDLNQQLFSLTAVQKDLNTLQNIIDTIILNDENGMRNDREFVRAIDDLDDYIKESGNQEWKDVWAIISGNGKKAASRIRLIKHLANPEADRTVMENSILPYRKNVFDEGKEMPEEIKRGIAYIIDNNMRKREILETYATSEAATRSPFASALTSLALQPHMQVAYLEKFQMHYLVDQVIDEVEGAGTMIGTKWRMNVEFTDYLIVKGFAAYLGQHSEWDPNGTTQKRIKQLDAFPWHPVLANDFEENQEMHKRRRDAFVETVKFLDRYKRTTEFKHIVDHIENPIGGATKQEWVRGLTNNPVHLYGLDQTKISVLYPVPTGEGNEVEWKTEQFQAVNENGTHTMHFPPFGFIIQRRWVPPSGRPQYSWAFKPDTLVPAVHLHFFDHKTFFFAGDEYKDVKSPGTHIVPRYDVKLPKYGAEGEPRNWVVPEDQIESRTRPEYQLKRVHKNEEWSFEENPPAYTAEWKWTVPKDMKPIVVPRKGRGDADIYVLVETVRRNKQGKKEKVHLWKTGFIRQNYEDLSDINTYVAMRTFTDKRGEYRGMLYGPRVKQVRIYFPNVQRDGKLTDMHREIHLESPEK